jgi:hypothetical protein
MSQEQEWRDRWLKVEQRPLRLADLTCSCGYVPDWLEPVGGATPYLSQAQGISREEQQSQMLFHLKAKGHTLA